MSAQEILTQALQDVVRCKRKLLPKPSRGVSFTWPLEDASLMYALSRYYRKSNSTVGTELFAPLMAEILKMLPEKDQIAIAKLADEMIVDFMQSNTVEEPVNLTTWRDFLDYGGITRQSHA